MVIVLFPLNAFAAMPVTRYVIPSTLIVDGIAAVFAFGLAAFLYATSGIFPVPPALVTTNTSFDVEAVTGVPTFAEPDVEAGFFVEVGFLEEVGLLVEAGFWEEVGLFVVVGFCETFGLGELVTDAVGRMDGAGFDDEPGVTDGAGFDDEPGSVDGAGFDDSAGSAEVFGSADGAGVASASSTVSKIAPYISLYLADT